MKKFVFCGLMVMAVALNLWAVDGIAVTVRNQTQYWHGDNLLGDIYRIDIKASDTVKSTKLVTGNSSHPHISPDGKHIAFFKNGGAVGGSGAKPDTICIMSIDGGTITKLCTTHPFSTLDFPNNNWIYWANGSNFSSDGVHRNNDSSAYIFRVSVNGGARESVVVMHDPPYPPGSTPPLVQVEGEDLVVDTGLTRLTFHPFYGGASGGYSTYFFSWN
ncbi:MAG: hypothetical protein PHC61_16720, partial [Chitinivibrionales bacterium]|nr:hypothetical protein [Chitinivibrionales bacterium]